MSASSSSSKRRGSRVVRGTTLIEMPGASISAMRISPGINSAAVASAIVSTKLVVADADAFPIPRKTEVVVLDPPRGGARGAIAAIAGARVRQVVYVSCEPSALARDARELGAAGYRLTALDTVELFPQTSHVEVGAVFLLQERNAKNKGGAVS